MKILVTGAAGFIGSALCLHLLGRNDEVIGIDNHNNYYNPVLKEERLKRHEKHPRYTHIRLDIVDQEGLSKVFEKYKPQIVVNLAAQAGVRYSLNNPRTYIDSNLVGFANILECCRHSKINHLVYASSSSVYGSNTLVPFSTKQNVDHPLSLYAATKTANELMAHSYSHLYSLPTTGLRFFTVYGPWDRPDMALQKFANLILQEKTIQVFNNGNHTRDFTYIDDIIEGVSRIIDCAATPDPNWLSDSPDPSTSSAPWRIYNIGNSNPINLMNYIEVLEKMLEKKAVKEFLPIQPGDVPNTWANVDDLIDHFNYKPNTTVEEGVSKFAAWFKKYYF